jgi:hypothetical protein
LPIRTVLWKVGATPELLQEACLPTEDLLEKMILADPRILSDEWMLIGRQIDTGHGRLDLLAVAPDGSLVLIELKRDRTPREVVAQALDYATWVQELGVGEIDAIYSQFLPGRKLSADFRERFATTLDEELLNGSHQIIIVAQSIDESTERILKYLSDFDVAINVICFQVFSHGTVQLLSRTWLIDPARTQVSASGSPARQKEPWNGEFYVSFGHDRSRSWEDAMQYGFISAGGGPWYSRTLEQLRPGDRCWVNVPGWGYVGVARVTGHMQPATEFKVTTPSGELPILEVARRGTYLRQYLDDPDKREYFVPVRWLDTVPLEQAVGGMGLFGNQNTVCKPKSPKWRSTVERLKERFAHYED